MMEEPKRLKLSILIWDALYEQSQKPPENEINHICRAHLLLNEIDTGLSDEEVHDLAVMTIPARFKGEEQL